MSTCALRPSVIFGPGDPQLIPSLHACIEKGETPFVIGDGLNMWDTTYVANVADAHLLAVENLLRTGTAAGQAIFISNEQPLPFRDFCLAVWREFGHHPAFELRIPEPLAMFAGCMAECVTWIIGGAATLSRGGVKDACQVRYCTGIGARKILGYQPRVGIEEGIRISCRVSGISDVLILKEMCIDIRGGICLAVEEGCAMSSLGLRERALVLCGRSKNIFGN